MTHATATILIATVCLAGPGFVLRAGAPDARGFYSAPSERESLGGGFGCETTPAELQPEMVGGGFEPQGCGQLASDSIDALGGFSPSLDGQWNLSLLQPASVETAVAGIALSRPGSSPSAHQGSPGSLDQLARGAAAVAVDAYLRVMQGRNHGTGTGDESRHSD